MNKNQIGDDGILCFTQIVKMNKLKLYNSLSVAYQSVKNDKMMSAFMSEFVSYNVLDADYLEDQGLEDQGNIRP